jgi:hypothetical protein
MYLCVYKDDILTNFGLDWLHFEIKDNDIAEVTRPTWSPSKTN